MGFFRTHKKKAQQFRGNFGAFCVRKFVAQQKYFVPTFALQRCHLKKLWREAHAQCGQRNLFPARLATLIQFSQTCDKSLVLYCHCKECGSNSTGCQPSGAALNHYIESTWTSQNGIFQRAVPSRRRFPCLGAFRVELPQKEQRELTCRV